MSPLIYKRPENLKEAIKLIKDGIPLGGGTRLAVQQHTGRKYVDLQALSMDEIKEHDDGWNLGAMVRIEALVEPEASLPSAFSLAARREAGWNLRNQASLGGVAMAADGRSPLLTCLLASGAEVTLEPGSKQVPLHDLLSQRDTLEGVLVTALRLPRISGLAYEQVSRSPADRPIVCAAASKIEGQKPAWRVAIGGFGAAPELIHDGGYDLETCHKKASDAYKEAGDAWASSDYRAEVAAILVGRVLGEVE
jgi:CO/xanthine dehydrogenase FAD-binding subunit